MKRPKPKIRDSASPVAEISAEYTRIRKLIEANEIVDAWNSAKVLHEKHPNDPLPNYAMAVILVGSKRNSAALRFAEAAVKYAPDNPGYHLFLGKLYVDLGMLEFAPPVLDRAVALDNTLFQAPWIMAEYYFGLGQGDKALQYYQTALEVVPKESMGFLKLAYANCIAAMGLIEDAETIFSGLLGDAGVRIIALAKLALLRKHDDESKIAVQIRTELAEKKLDDKERSLLLLSLGRLFENGGKFDDAFRNFQESRKLAVSTHDIHRFRSEVDDVIRTLTPAVMSKFGDFGDPTDRPIFVVGMPRSGTTMTEQIIASHSQVEGAGELNRISLMAKKFAGDKGMAGILEKMTAAGPLNWKAVSRQYLNLLEVLAPGARHVVDKMPHNFRHLGFIHFCFPNARIIHCRRAPLDNFISAFQNDLNNFHSYGYDQTAYGEYYLEYTRLMNHWKKAIPGRIYDLQYETLVQNPETEIRKMLEFLGLPWEESCLRFSERKSAIKTISRLQVRNAINTGSIARWRNYEKHLSPIIAVFKQAEIQF
jgi:tetratricopeptide (TPR) repeat protein